MSNHVTITGNLGSDPELRFIPSGKAVATISVGDTPRRRNRDTNQWEDAGETLWLRCSVWGDAAETLAEHAKRGDKVVVTGRLKSRSWEKDGQTRTVTECDADTVAIVPKNQTQRSSSQVHQQSDPWSQRPAQAVSSGGGWSQSPAFDSEPPFAFPPNSPVN